MNGQGGGQAAPPVMWKIPKRGGVMSRAVAWAKYGVKTETTADRPWAPRDFVIVDPTGVV